MTTISFNNHSTIGHRSRRSSYNTYNVGVECEENEFYEFEVDADSYSHACEIAEMQAMEMYMNILYITVDQIA